MEIVVCGLKISDLLAIFLLLRITCINYITQVSIISKTRKADLNFIGEKINKNIRTKILETS